MIFAGVVRLQPSQYLPEHEEVGGGGERCKQGH